MVANSWSQAESVLFPAFVRAQDNPDKDEHESQCEAGPDLIAFVPKVIANGTPPRCGKILPEMIPWFGFGRTLEEKHDQPGKYGNRNPVKDGFQRIPPLQI